MLSPLIALLLPAAATSPQVPQTSPLVPPAIDEGWVFPTSRANSTTADCPVIGRVYAEIKQDDRGVRVIEVRGMGRVSNAEDRQRIDAILRPLNGFVYVDVGCWSRDAADIVVNGFLTVNGASKDGRIDFLWTANGPMPLSPDAIYPSVPR